MKLFFADLVHGRTWADKSLLLSAVVTAALSVLAYRGVI